MVCFSTNARDAGSARAWYLYEAGFTPALAALENYVADIDKGKCTCRDIKLYGKVKVVDHFPDLKVQTVDHFPDIKVQKVDHFPDGCGKWQFVDHFPDFTIQYVDHFPDLKVKFVDHFPGM